MYLPHFEKFQEFAIADLKKATIHAQANFLVAMGIFNYIEILGSFAIKQTEKLEDRFDFVFENLLNPEYLELKKEIDKLKLKEKDPKDGKTKNRSIYSLLRCGMTHEFMVKNYRESKHTFTFQIVGVNNESEYEKCISTLNCGLVLYKESKSELLLKIYNAKLIDDLNNAFEKYKTEILPTNQDLLKKRCEQIGLDRLN